MAQLESIGPELWASVCRVALPGGTFFMSRMSVLRNQGGELCLYSPIPIDDELASEIDALGEVAHIIAPNGFHHLYAGKAKVRYPAAKLWASQALQAKKTDFEPDAWLDGTSHLGEGIELLEILGAPKIQEFVLVHNASRSLVFADLAFHIEYETNFATSAVLWMAGVGGKRLAQSRVWRMSWKDKDAGRASIDTLFNLDFDRLVPGHGSVTDQGGKALLREALWWIRGEKKPAA